MKALIKSSPKYPTVLLERHADGSGRALVLLWYRGQVAPSFRRDDNGEIIGVESLGMHRVFVPKLEDVEHFTKEQFIEQTSLQEVIWEPN